VFVIVNWNGREALLRCLESVYAVDYPRFEVVVVDNGSADGSGDAVAERFPRTVLVRLDENSGAIVGRNIGLRKGFELGADYLLTLDNDQVIDRDFVKAGVAIAERDPRVAMVGGIIYFLSRPGVIETAGGIIDYSENVARNRGFRQEDRGQFTKDEKVEWIGTGGLLSRRKALEVIGLCDEEYVGYALEDTDWGVRARKAGYDVIFSPSLKTWHEGHADVGGYSFGRKYFWAYNAVVFMRRYARWHQRLKFSLLACGGLLYALAVQTPRGNLGGVVGKAEGLYDGLRRNRARALRILRSGPPWPWRVRKRGG
jgi:GT2 family glycosyltransferase